jgi:hypothetical protein
MKTKTEEQKLPKWFNGTHYSKGEEVTNQFSGASYYLNATELSMFDFIMGSQYMIEMRGGVFHPATRDLQKEMAKGLSWFRENNGKAYGK